MLPKEFAAMLKARRGAAEGQWYAKCPAHGDTNDSLSIGTGRKGQIVLKCHAGCLVPEIVEAVGMGMEDLWPTKGEKKKRSRGKIVAEYSYRDAKGELRYQVCRLEPKSFRQRAPDGRGGWVWSIRGVRPLIYRLPELLASSPSDMVFVVEGEKDADRLAHEGLVATTSSGGAGKWPKGQGQHFEGRNVTIIPDRDLKGLEHAENIIADIGAKAKSVHVLNLPNGVKDVSDYLAKHTIDDLLAIPLRSTVDKPEPHPNAPGVDGPEPQGIVVERVVRMHSRFPMRLAERWLRDEASLEDGTPLLRRWRSEWYRWSDELGCYVVLGRESVEAELRDWLDHVQYPDKNGNWKDYCASRQSVGEVERALITPGILVDGTAPQWLAGAKKPGPVDEYLVCPNALLHLPTGTKRKPDPCFFSTTSVGAPLLDVEPRPRQWLLWLEQLFPNDSESLELLQEWFGYCLTADTSQQKALMVVGPPRCGKGTIARVLGALLGSHSVAGPTLSSLSERFGLAPLLGKSLAVIADARLSHRTDLTQIVERILAVTGEDAISVDRKRIDAVTEKLSARFMILTNEVPRFPDASGAIASRFMILRLRKGYLGNEDLTLLGRLLKELPQILRWAIVGWKRLRKRGRFIQPASADQDVLDLRDMGSPISSFVEDCCEVGPEHRASLNDLYLEWKSWCSDAGRDAVGTKATFSRNLTAAFPSIERLRGRDQFGKRYKVCEGISIAHNREPQDDLFD